MAEKVRTCVICGNNTSVLYSLPRNSELRNRWLEFIYGTPPARYNTYILVCCSHFERSDFSNYGEYSRGFASMLILKPGSVPSRRSTTSSQPSTSQTLVTPIIHTSTQTDPPSLLCRATQLSRGTQTESFITSTSIATSTLDAPWGPVHSTPIKSVVPRAAKRPWVDEEEEEEEEEDEESDHCTVPTEPQSSTYDPAQLKPTYWPSVSGNSLLIRRTTQAGTTTRTFLPK
ncbi:uncharacterized protein LOC111193905 isoform X2 [Astyanax mexicanus]|uniref:uncharacterized protein LOC111193905 isoform X2 n=1 Tax=Astyanax mexicanus TaxID=7994 RepID=UPI0020CB6674|nr:uncharacterized protein LOC111193905 isoform X2 [Astyanax mexicanus]